MATHPVSNPASKEWLLLENAAMITLDDGHPTGRAVLINGARIAEVFDTPRPDPGALPGRLRRVDLRGATVVPGFTDSHIHLVDWGISLGRANLESARSAEETARLLGEFHRGRRNRAGASRSQLVAFDVEKARVDIARHEP